MKNPADPGMAKTMSLLKGNRLKDVAPSLYWMTPRDKMLMRDLRYSMRENQTQFWSRFGVGQSSGSRFESGVAIPLPVLLLIRLYFLRIINDQDLEKVGSPAYDSSEPAGTGEN